MDAQAFWNVIGEYNQNTILIQGVLLVLTVLAAAGSYNAKRAYFAKWMLGTLNLWIGIVFFCFYGTQPIQKFFFLPLFLLCGVLFLYEAYKNKNDALKKPDFFQLVLFSLYFLFPVVSFALGNRFPKMVTHIMPCPVGGLSIALYAGYKRKNKLLLLLLTIWGLAGITSIMFHVYEDVILFICGMYGVYLLIKELRGSKG